MKCFTGWLCLHLGSCHVLDPGMFVSCHNKNLWPWLCILLYYCITLYTTVLLYDCATLLIYYYINLYNTLWLCYSVYYFITVILCILLYYWVTLYILYTTVLLCILLYYSITLYITVLLCSSVYYCITVLLCLLLYYSVYYCILLYYSICYSFDRKHTEWEPTLKIFWHWKHPQGIKDNSYGLLQYNLAVLVGLYQFDNALYFTHYFPKKTLPGNNSITTFKVCFNMVSHSGVKTAQT